MRALQFWKAVTMDRSDFLERVLAVLEPFDFCVIDGVAVNAYSAPVVTEDVHIAIAIRDASNKRCRRSSTSAASRTA
jgi:hypothetical protein